MVKSVRLNFVDWLAFVLIIVGGFNWGLVGLLNFDLVSFVFSGLLMRIIYVLVFGSSVYWVWRAFNMRG